MRENQRTTPEKLSMAVIVIIEDNPQNGRLVTKLLRGAGHTVHLCETGESGLQTALETLPNLILIDLGLPDLDGQTVIALLRQQPVLRGRPLIAFTSWPESTAHSMAKAYGCDGVITKPIDTRQFVAQLEAFMLREAPHTTTGGPEITAPSEPPSVPVLQVNSPNGASKRADQ
jgi:CheY-like chemotaxis protein